MASHDQMEDDFEGFICLPQLQTDNSIEVLPADSGANDNPVPFPFLPLEFPPFSSTGDLYGYQQNYPSAAVNDLNMGINVDECPMNIPVDKVLIDVDEENDIPISEHQGQGFNFPSARVDKIRSRDQTPNNLMTPYHGMSRVPDFENVVASNDRIFNNSNSHMAGNLDMSVLHAETQNNSRQPTEMYRNFTNFSGSSANEQLIDPRVYDNQVGVDSSLPNRLGKLDGRFLSLGYQSIGASNVSSNTYGRKANHMGETSLSPQGHLANNSFNYVRDSLVGFQNNVGGLMTPWDSAGNQTFAGDDSFRAMNYGNDMNPVSNLYGESVNTHHYIPTPSSRTSESRSEVNSRIYSSDPSDYSGANSHMLSNFSSYDQGLDDYMNRRMQGVPFNSSVLRSNHQSAAGPLQSSLFSTNFMSPPGRGESDNLNKSGLALGTNSTSSSVQAGDLIPRSNRLRPAGMPSRQYSSGLLPAGQSYPPYTIHGWHSTGQAADISVRNELLQASTDASRESLKRHLDCPPRASIQGYQRRKIMTESSVQQFSPDLLQNALGQIAVGHSTPACTTFGNSSIVPSAVLKDLASNGWARNTTSFCPLVKTVGAFNTARVSQHHMASAAASVSPIHISATRCASQEISSNVYSSTMNSPASLAKTSAAGMVAAKSPAFASLPMDVPPVALASTIAIRSDLARSPIPGTYSKRVTAAATSSSGRRLASATALRNAHLLHATSHMTRPSLSEWRKSLPALAALVKAAPGFRVSQVPSSMHRIKFQGFDVPPTVGFKCMLCKRDLSFAPESPVIQPSIAPAVAVLPCGHTFHDDCLLLITTEDQSKDPPCIPCAMGEN